MLQTDTLNSMSNRDEQEVTVTIGDLRNLIKKTRQLAIREHINQDESDLTFEYLLFIFLFAHGVIE